MLKNILLLGSVSIALTFAQSAWSFDQCAPASSVVCTISEDTGSLPMYLLSTTVQKVVDYISVSSGTCTEGCPIDVTRAAAALSTLVKEANQLKAAGACSTIIIQIR